MKKTIFNKPEFSVAMSFETGCVVFVRNEGEKQKIIGSLTREDSLKFAQGIINWVPESVRVEPEKPKLSLVN
jgi:hypothetical protein